MKAKVLQTFKDKSTKKVHFVGSIVELNEKRINELAEKGYVEAAEKVKAEKPKS